MALIVKQQKRLEHPTETGTWFVVRVPLTAGDLGQFEGGLANEAQIKVAALARSLQEWSYDAPVSRQSIEDLDLETFNWLVEQLFVASEVRTEDEKKDLSSSSPLTAAPGEERSPVSSGT